MKLFLANIKHTENLGDIVCSVANYFQFPCETEHIDIREYSSGNVIFGGGGLLHPGLESIMESATTSHHILVAWSIGNNYHNNNEYVDHAWLGEFDCVGLRDHSPLNKFHIVPCVSCMHPIFDIRTSPTRDVVVYNHHELPIPIGGGIPAMDNRGSLEKFPEVVGFLQSGRVVLTNSYHGAYWASLLGRPVVLFNPFANRFAFTNPSYTTANKTDWESRLAEAQLPEPDLLQKFRSSNIGFHNRVMEVIENSL